MAEMNESRFLDKIGLNHLLNYLHSRYDKKLDSVTNSDDSTEITSGREIAVKVSAAENNLLQVKHDNGEEGLYVPPTTAMPHKLTFGANEQYTYDGSKDVTVPVYNGELF